MSHDVEPSRETLAALEGAIRADLDRERGVLAFLRAQPAALRLVVLLAVAAAIAALTLAIAPRPDLHVYPRGRLVVTIVYCTVTAAVAAWVALRPIYLPRPSHATIAVAAGLALLGPIVAAAWPAVPMAHPVAHRVLPWAYGCFAGGAVAALAALLAARALDRGGAHAGGQVVLACAAAGLVGTTSLLLHCPINYPLHLLLGHATVPLVLAAAIVAARRL